MIRITFSPVRMDRELTVAASGDVLALDGLLFDLSQLGEGDRLPGDAIGHDLIDGDVTRADGVIHLTIRRPHGIDAAEADRFPAPLDGAAFGALAGTPGTVDWQRLQTAEALAGSNLAAWRASATMSRTEFCLALVVAGILSSAEAIGAARGDIPASFEPVVAAIPEPAQTAVRIRWAAMTEVERLNPFVAMVAEAAAIPAATLDAIFGWQA